VFAALQHEGAADVIVDVTTLDSVPGWLLAELADDFEVRHRYQHVPAFAGGSHAVPSRSCAQTRA
jgi:hypothetical protein